MLNLKEYSSEQELKEIICEIGKRMYERGYVVANDGNISVMHGDKEIWATPTGVSKGFMTPDMLVKHDLDGNVLEGSLKPSSEIKMHLKVYKENPLVKAVVHAHPPMATTFSIAGLALERPVLAEAIMSLGIVPLAPYATPGTEEVPDSIEPYCRDFNAVLLANHGALSWGRDPQEAYFRMESLEYYAQILKNLGSSTLRPKEFTVDQIEALIGIREGLSRDY